MSFSLKLSLFATGCAGIVAEFVLSTLATYLLGNAVFQWTIVMSLMLFAMGVGSRISKRFGEHLLDTFIAVEFCLSLFCASAAVLAYGLAAYTSQINLIIYAMSAAIGVLIGMEIPLVARLNEAYEELRVNIASVMEKDYLGSLVGGLLFAFVALPHLGLTYTPIILGGINFIVASILLWIFYSLLKHKRLLIGAFLFCAFFLITLLLLAKPIILFGEQAKYRDKVIYTAQTPYQKIVMTQWREFYWLFLNGKEQFSTYDEEKYHEPLVHPALSITSDQAHVLILGGGDGLALREILKHDNVESVTLVDMDRNMTELATSFPILVDINQGSMMDKRLTVINRDAKTFLRNDSSLYGVIIVDMPDPATVDLMHVYSRNFYSLAAKHLIRGGVFVTQATSPFFARDAFLCIVKTMRAAGFSVFPYHTNIPTLGEWGWVLGVKEEEANDEQLKKRVLSADFSRLRTRFLNNDAMISMAYFGKDVFEDSRIKKLSINTEFNPVLYTYYLAGNWGAY